MLTNEPDCLQRNMMTRTTSKPCPICGKPRSEKQRPFCSQGCRDRDLARWFGDGYAVPGEPVNLEDVADLEDVAKSDADGPD